MPTKNVFLFDENNLPLKVVGIQIELFDSNSGFLIDKKLSINRTPRLGLRSKEWGADLTFDISSNPLDIYITDKTYEYPGNTIHSLNGETTDRIDLDLMKIPTSPLSNPLSSNSTPAYIVSAILKEPFWTIAEKKAAINLLMNYIDIVYKGAISSPELANDLQSIITNWSNALQKLGIDGIDLGLPIFGQEEYIQPNIKKFNLE